jgi:hypothetical protein
VASVAPLYEVAWSPDGSLLALSDRSTVPSLYRVADGTLVRIPSTLDRAKGLGLFLGWIDAGHLAIDLFPPDQNLSVPPSQTALQTLQLASLDIASGQVRVIATWRSSMLGQAWFSLAPDGTAALFYNTQFRSDPFTPEVDLVTLATGQVTPLPHLAQAMNQFHGFTNLAWRPGTHAIAVSEPYGDNYADAHTWLLDLDHDTYTQVPGITIPLAWMPDHGPLIVLTGFQGQTTSVPYNGTYSIGAAQCADGGSNCKVTTLINGAGTPAFVGIVRTA